MRVTVLDVSVDALTGAQVVERLIALAATGSGAVALYVNAHILNLAQRDAALRAHLQAADLVRAGGQGVVWAARWLGAPLPERVTFADIYEPFFHQAQERRLRCFLLGGRPGVAERAAAAIRRRWAGVAIAGAHHGYFTGGEESHIAALIAEARPDVVLVGMGTPRQEDWAMRAGRRLPVHLVCCVGAMFDQIAGIEPWAPSWVRAAGLEWLLRLLGHPRRFWRRYLLGFPAFGWRVLTWGMRRRHDVGATPP